MKTSELIVTLTRLRGDKSSVKLSTTLLDEVIDRLNSEVVLTSESGEELARIDVDTVATITPAALEQYVIDAMIISTARDAVERLRLIARTGNGRLTQADAAELLLSLETGQLPSDSTNKDETE